jgi:hypothetical protein
MDDDPRVALETQLGLIVPPDLPALAAAWSSAFSDELAAAQRVLAEHERGDLSRPGLPRSDPATGGAGEDGPRPAAAEQWAPSGCGAVVAVHAADLINPAPGSLAHTGDSWTVPAEGRVRPRSDLPRSLRQADEPASPSVGGATRQSTGGLARPGPAAGGVAPTVRRRPRHSTRPGDDRICGYRWSLRLRRSAGRSDRAIR